MQAAVLLSQDKVHARMAVPSDARLLLVCWSLPFLCPLCCTSNHLRVQLHFVPMPLFTKLLRTGAMSMQQASLTGRYEPAG